MFELLFQEERIVKYFDALLEKACDDFLEIKQRMQAVRPFFIGFLPKSLPTADASL